MSFVAFEIHFIFHETVLSLDSLTSHSQVFDEFTVDDGSPTYAFTQLMLPYMPYFSNCRGFDSYIPIYALLESSECSLPDDYTSDWWR